MRRCSLIFFAALFAVPTLAFAPSHANTCCKNRRTTATDLSAKRSSIPAAAISNSGGIGRSVVTTGLFLLLHTAGAVLGLAQLPASASSYGSLSDEQKVVAEAWRLVDNSFLDRSFNHQDWFATRQDYVFRKYRTVDEAHAAIEQMVASLGDKYTRYLSPAKYQSLVDSATGTLTGTTAGVGIEISEKNGKLVASDTQENSPAAAAGVRPGDVFVEVDGTAFDETSTPDDVAVQLRGPKGSRVGVVMERDGKKIDYILTREPITITAVRSYMSSAPGVGKVGVIRIKNFSGTTASTVAQKYSELKKKGASALVLDLRGNPGGLLPGGVDTASLFLDENAPVVFVVNKQGVVDSQSALSRGMDLDTPLLLLVDGSTASAAEVVTAALKENGRAVVAGEQTFGKGIVQTIRELSGGNGGVAITVARYETPNRNDINKRGIAVDVSLPVDCPKDDVSACFAKSNSGNNLFQKPSTSPASSS